nr:hypothetical protein Iba_chr05dCG10140 [Ipomoea batatas]
MCSRASTTDVPKLVVALELRATSQTQGSKSCLSHGWFPKLAFCILVIGGITEQEPQPTSFPVSLWLIVNFRACRQRETNFIWRLIKALVRLILSHSASLSPRKILASFWLKTEVIIRSKARRNLGTFSAEGRSDCQIQKLDPEIIPTENRKLHQMLEPTWSKQMTK